MNRFLLVRKGRNFKGEKLTSIDPLPHGQTNHLRICGPVLRCYFNLPKGQRRIWLCFSSSDDPQDTEFAYQYHIDVPVERSDYAKENRHLCRYVNLYSAVGASYRPMLHEITHYLAWHHPRIPTAGWVSVEYEV